MVTNSGTSGERRKDTHGTKPQRDVGTPISTTDISRSTITSIKFLTDRVGERKSLNGCVKEG